jgi:putative endonuclease
MKDHTYYVYILSNKRRRLYVGVTNNLMIRVKQHKNAEDPDSFTARYRIDQLVHFECFPYVNDAIRREKELKGWLRERKLALIVLNNPTWRDLSADWGKPIEPFDEKKMRPPMRFQRAANYRDSSPMAQNDKT